MANVCTKGTAQFETVNAAVKAEGYDTISLLGNVAEDVVIPMGMSATIDLAGHTISAVASHAITVERNATLTVTSSAKNGIVDGTINGKAALYVMPGGSATIEGGKFTRSKEDSTSQGNSWYVIQNQGALVITGDANVENKSTLSSAIENGFDSGRQADVDAFNSMQDPEYVATVSMTGGNVASNVIGLKNDECSTSNVSGGKIVAKTQAVLNWTVCDITGGTLNSSGSGTVVTNGTYNGSAGQLTISGGTFNTIVADGNIIAGVEGYSSEAVVISGGDFAKLPPVEYLAPGVSYITDSKGRVTLSTSIWRYPDGGVVGGGFNGFKRLIMRADAVDYVAGGFAIPKGFYADTLLEASVKGGAMAWFDRTNNKVLLYTANGKEASGTMNDVTIVLIGH